MDGLPPINRLIEPHSLAVDPQIIKAFDEPDLAKIRFPVLGFKRQRVGPVAYVHRPFLTGNQGFQAYIARDLQSRRLNRGTHLLR